MTFPSKVDRWLLIFFALAALLPLVAAGIAVHQGEPWLVHVLFAALLAGFFAWFVLSTKYTVHDGVIQVRSGPFKWTIEACSVTSLTSSKSPFSGPALSLDRIRIEYESGRKSLLISPKDKEGFVRAIESAQSAA